MSDTSLKVFRFASAVDKQIPSWLLKGLFALSVVLWLFSVFTLYARGSALFAAIWLATLVAVVVVYSSKRFDTVKFIFPSLMTVGLFVLLPIVITAAIGFTNYSGRHLIAQERAYNTILLSTVQSDSERLDFSLADMGNDRVAIFLSSDQGQWISPAFLLTDYGANESVRMTVSATLESPELLSVRSVANNRGVLQNVEVFFEDGQRFMMAGFREFAAMELRFESSSIEQIIERSTGNVFAANYETGFYQDTDGNTLTPGFFVNVGFDNFQRTLTDENISAPFWAIFAWTVAFASLTVVFTLFVGLPLACLISVKDLRFSGFYRVMLILPYAVPAFISILVFRGLFNQSFGEINFVLQNLFGISPQWFDHPVLAKVMVLIVNTWLGYPYIMLLSLGLLKTIPSDLYEASSLEGASVITNFFKITFPLVMKPLTPLLVASFAFNFNNFVIITLLTRGGPDFLNTTTPAGHTDLLVSYTYRIAFQDQGQNFALAAAISMLIFILVGLLALINIKLAKVKV